MGSCDLTLTATAAWACIDCGRPLASDALKERCPECLFRFITTTVGPLPPPRGEHPLAELKAGQEISAGRFTLIKLLGRGGMGVVWLAADRNLSLKGQPYFGALKFLSEEIRADPEALENMRKEVLASRRLTHPNVVQMFDLVSLPDEPPYINMEYVEGQSLRDWLRHHPAGVLPWRFAVHLARQLCDALVHAHETAFIVHRDLKPANLMVDASWHLKLTDFGIARPLDPGALEATEQHVRGTLAYMSPQQLNGQLPQAADDMYSFGATLYELLTGTTPFFEAESLEQLFSLIYHQNVESIPERLARVRRENNVPDKLKILIARCLEKHPANRPAARECLYRLPEPSLDEAIEIPTLPESALEGTGEARRRWPWLRPAIHGGILLMLLGSCLLAGLTEPGRQLVNELIKKLSGNVVIEQDQRNGTNFTNHAAVLISTDPTNATIVLSTNVEHRLQRQFYELQSDMETNIPSGLYFLQISYPGFRTFSGTFLLNPGPHNLGMITLEPISPPPGHLHLQAYSVKLEFESFTFSATPVTNGWTTNLEVNARESGSVTFTNVPAGPYDLTIKGRRSGNQIWTVPSRANVETNATTTVRHRLDWATLIIRSTPSPVFVEKLDESGWTPLRTLTPAEDGLARAGVNRYRLSQEGYVTLITNIPVAGGDRRTVDIALPRSQVALLGEHWTNTLGMPLRWIPDRQQAMGGYWFAATETTVAAYAQFARDHPLPTAPGMYSVTRTGIVQCGFTWAQPGFFQTNDHPVVGVSWQDAVAFCEWLTASEREQGRLKPTQEYQLPTDAQWSRVAGANRYPWGGEWLPLHNPSQAPANVAGEETANDSWFTGWPVITGYLDDHPRTAPVNRFPANAWGVSDLAGNVAEWCRDWYHPNLNPPEVLAANACLREAGDGATFKVLRGGSWFDDDQWMDLQTATRQRARPGERHDRFGFRVVLNEERNP